MYNLLTIIFSYFLINRMLKFLKYNSFNKLIVEKLDFFFLLRPTSFFVIWLIISIGMYLPLYSNGSIELFITDFSFKTFLFFMSLSLFSSILSIDNQLAKTENSFLIRSSFDEFYLNKIKKSLLILTVLLILISCWPLFFILTSIFLISSKIGTNINTNYLKLFIYHFFIIFIFLYMGIYYQLFNSNIQFNTRMMIASVPYLFIFFTIYLFKESYGSSNDISKTLVDNFPKKNIAIVGFILSVFALVLSLYLEDPLASTALSISVFFMLYVLLRGLKKDFIRSIRYIIGIFNFFILTIYPLLVFPIIIIFYISKYYYWHRFSIHYPTFLVTTNTFCSVHEVVNEKNKK